MIGALRSCTALGSLVGLHVFADDLLLHLLSLMIIGRVILLLDLACSVSPNLRTSLVRVDHNMDLIDFLGVNMGTFVRLAPHARISCSVLLVTLRILVDGSGGAKGLIGFTSSSQG